MQLMEDEEELVINCLGINHNTYLEYLKDNRDYIITLLIETTRKILHVILDTNTSNQNTNNPTNNYAFNINTYNNKLTEEECQIMSQLLRNGLVVFEQFHNFKLHTEEKDKINPFKDFMSLYVSI